jgi:hypothetical protein
MPKVTKNKKNTEAASTITRIQKFPVDELVTRRISQDIIRIQGLFQKCMTYIKHYRVKFNTPTTNLETLMECSRSFITVKGYYETGLKLSIRLLNKKSKYVKPSAIQSIQTISPQIKIHLSGWIDSLNKIIKEQRQVNEYVDLCLDIIRNPMNDNTLTLLKKECKMNIEEEAPDCDKANMLEKLEKGEMFLDDVKQAFTEQWNWATIIYHYHLSSDESFLRKKKLLLNIVDGIVDYTYDKQCGHRYVTVFVLTSQAIVEELSTREIIIQVDSDGDSCDNDRDDFETYDGYHTQNLFTSDEFKQVILQCTLTQNVFVLRVFINLWGIDYIRKNICATIQAKSTHLSWFQFTDSECEEPSQVYKELTQIDIGTPQEDETWFNFQYVKSICDQY